MTGKKTSLPKVPLPDFVIQSQEPRHCHLCTRRIEDGEIMTIYGSDKNWAAPEQRQDLPQTVAQRDYCEYCYWRSIPLPHRGTDEYLLIGKCHERDSEYHFDQKGAIDASGPTSGIDWSPTDVYDELLLPREFPHSEKVPEHRGLNPATVYDELFIHGIRLESFVTEDGRLEIPADQKHRLSKIVEENQERRSQRRASFLYGPTREGES